MLQLLHAGQVDGIKTFKETFHARPSHLIFSKRIVVICLNMLCITFLTDCFHNSLNIIDTISVEKLMSIIFSWLSNVVETFYFPNYPIRLWSVH